MKALLFLLFFASIPIAWAHPGHAWDPDGPLEISINHPAFNSKENLLYLGSLPFTGVVVDELEINHPKLVETDIPNAIIIGRFCYQDGVRHGTSYQWHPNGFMKSALHFTCLLYTSDAADD